MHLLDTATVIDLRAARDRGADHGLTAWASGVATQSLFISAITLHELEGVAAQSTRRDRGDGARWRSWIDDHVMRAFDGRVISVDAAIVRRAAQLGYADQRDGLIAGTALEHGLTLVTSRTRAFKGGKVKLFDPAGYTATPAADDWRNATRAAPAWIKNLFVRS